MASVERVDRGPLGVGSHVRVQQRLRSLRPSGLIDDPPVTQEHHPIGPRRQLGVVGDDDTRDAAFAGLADQAHHRLTVDRVQGTGRFICQQQVPLADHRASDSHTLPLPAGQFVGKPVGPLGQPELAKGAQCRRSRAAHRDTVQL